MKAKDLLGHPRVRRLLGRIAATMLRVLGSTWRLTFEGTNPLEAGASSAVAGIWHRNALITAYSFRDQGFSVPISRSRDGDLIAEMLSHLGYLTPPRGSSSRGGAAALRELAGIVKSGVTVSVQPDGPRGPARKAKSGIAALSRLTRVPITPVSFSASPCIRFRSWDGTLLPLPFARVVCVYSAGLPLPDEADPDCDEHLSLQLELELNRCTDELDQRLGRLESSDMSRD